MPNPPSPIVPPNWYSKGYTCLSRTGTGTNQARSVTGDKGGDTGGLECVGSRRGVESGERNTRRVSTVGESGVIIERSGDFGRAGRGGRGGDCGPCRFDVDMRGREGDDDENPRRGLRAPASRFCPS